MFNRRSLIATTALGISLAGTGYRVAAQDNVVDLPLKNASFIQPAGVPATPVAEQDPSEFHGYIYGDPNAPHTMQLYTDYRCPHCRVFHVDVEPELVRDFVETGIMNLEFLDFTIIGVKSFDDLGDDSIESVQAAEAAACAAEQEAFLDYRSWLYEGDASTKDGDFSDDNLIAAAADLELDVDMFTTSLKNGVYEDGIIQSVIVGIQHGVQGTPTMILDNIAHIMMPVEGYPALKRNLETLLG